MRHIRCGGLRANRSSNACITTVKFSKKQAVTINALSSYPRFCKSDSHLVNNRRGNVSYPYPELIKIENFVLKEASILIRSDREQDNKDNASIETKLADVASEVIQHRTLKKERLLNSHGILDRILLDRTKDSSSFIFEVNNKININSFICHMFIKTFLTLYAELYNLLLSVERESATFSMARLETQTKILRDIRQQLK